MAVDISLWVHCCDAKADQTVLTRRHRELRFLNHPSSADIPPHPKGQNAGTSEIRRPPHAGSEGEDSFGVRPEGEQPNPLAEPQRLQHAVPSGVFCKSWKSPGLVCKVVYSHASLGDDFWGAVFPRGIFLRGVLCRVSFCEA